MLPRSQLKGDLMSKMSDENRRRANERLKPMLDAIAKRRNRGAKGT